MPGIFVYSSSRMGLANDNPKTCLADIYLFVATSIPAEKMARNSAICSALEKETIISSMIKREKRKNRKKRWAKLGGEGGTECWKTAPLLHTPRFNFFFFSLFSSMLSWLAVPSQLFRAGEEKESYTAVRYVDRFYAIFLILMMLIKIVCWALKADCDGAVPLGSLG